MSLLSPACEFNHTYFNCDRTVNAESYPYIWLRLTVCILHWIVKTRCTWRATYVSFNSKVSQYGDPLLLSILKQLQVFELLVSILRFKPPVKNRSLWKQISLRGVDFLSYTSSCQVNMFMFSIEVVLGILNQKLSWRGLYVTSELILLSSNS